MLFRSQRIYDRCSVTRLLKYYECRLRRAAVAAISRPAQFSVLENSEEISWRVPLVLRWRYSMEYYGGQGAPGPFLNARNQHMARVINAAQWASLVRQSDATAERDRLLGLSVKLAARVLNITPSRVHQLLKQGKLSAIDVYDERRKRSRLVTLQSIDYRRRTVRPRRTQWRSTR